ncbi:MAG: helix-turn-helix domain-containing protein [Blastochloris sp.]|nr:helix-turn-helix domain-containing protein [Blastochloris sp.]
MTDMKPIRRILQLDGSTDGEQLEKVLKALDAPNRVKILRYLSDRIASVNDIAATLEIPTSTAAAHVEMLEEAGLIRTELEPASRGLRKACSRMYDRVVLDLPVLERPRADSIELAMPIGAFVDNTITPTCGLLGDDGPIGLLDDPTSFYEPRRVDAQLVWFHTGYLEYRFPNRLPPMARPESLYLSMEVCSEAPLYNLDWPSDLTVWVNGVELGSWTSPGDFGGERGRLTPEWWSPRNTQYGLLKVWSVGERGAAVDGVPISETTVQSLRLAETPYIAVRIGVKPDARHVGGINLFGRRFGNYPQDLVLRVVYRSRPADSSSEMTDHSDERHQGDEHSSAERASVRRQRSQGGLR